MSTQEVQKVRLTVSQLLNDLSNGLTWYKSEDVGFGSIQEKYGAFDFHINMFKGHAKLKDVQPRLVQFELHDDLKEEEEEAPVNELLNETQVTTAPAEETTIVNEVPKEAEKVVQHQSSNANAFLNI